MNTKAFIAEFIGTFTLVFVGVGAIAGNHINGGQTGLLGIAMAHGLAIATMVAATAAISGGHLNPAVTIAMLVTKKIDGVNATGYVIAQCLAGIAAAVFVKICFAGEVLAAVGMGTPALADGVGVGAGLLMEIVLTFFLVFVIYGAAVDKRGPATAPLFIGLAVAMDILIGGPVTGAAMNPARHLGPALLGGGLQNFWLYWVGPVAGGVLAGLLYNSTLLEQK
ncbi:MAG: MIP/aquaporin family protein [Candidatus Omnitrophota bacterium]